MGSRHARGRRGRSARRSRSGRRGRCRRRTGGSSRTARARSPPAAAARCRAGCRTRTGHRGARRRVVPEVARSPRRRVCRGRARSSSDACGLDRRTGHVAVGLGDRRVRPADVGRSERAARASGAGVGVAHGADVRDRRRGRPGEPGCSLARLDKRLGKRAMRRRRDPFHLTRCDCLGAEKLHGDGAHSDAVGVHLRGGDPALRIADRRRRLDAQPEVQPRQRSRHIRLDRDRRARPARPATRQVGRPALRTSENRAELEWFRSLGIRTAG